jgi:hypothetical protein
LNALWPNPLMSCWRALKDSRAILICEITSDTIKRPTRKFDNCQAETPGGHSVRRSPFGVHRLEFRRRRAQSLFGVCRAGFGVHRFATGHGIDVLSFAYVAYDQIVNNGAGEFVEARGSDSCGNSAIRIPKSDIPHRVPPRPLRDARFPLLLALHSGSPRENF